MSYALKITTPLVNVLRMTDFEKMPGIGFIYCAMDSAKEQIAKILGNEEVAYKEIRKIIDDKWEFQLHQQLHAAAYFLNARFQYSEDYSSHREVKMGLLMWMAKLIPNDNDRLHANLQIDFFRNKKWLFSLDSKKLSSTIVARFGDETPELKGFVMTVLSLTCSSSTCERNWSTFNTIHTKKRNRLDTKKLNSLVYIMYNTRLKHIFLKKQALKDDEDPLVCEDVPIDDECIVEQDAVGETSTNVDMREPSGSQQVGEKRRRNTMGKQQEPFLGQYEASVGDKRGHWKPTPLAKLNKIFKKHGQKNSGRARIAEFTSELAEFGHVSILNLIDWFDNKTYRAKKATEESCTQATSAGESSTQTATA
ncbi:hypothetical protein Dsin_016022 [Dipteronia sinensis]|uniref:HAT C-terminal dimerisation domain-containing protein n=1 Tax=Dipteronia sinensis TaxID=43782 RepID=A0AAE0ACB0_9ROSI|nr:hypothetical protein Dsin_016022 [Dipteronia sinensis]